MLVLCVGLGVDILHKPGALRLDCLLESSKALLQVVLVEARPRWLHVGPPCTFWCWISRWVAHATPEGWYAKRKQARTHLSCAWHLLSSQEARGDKGSIEQPAGRASWKLGVTHDFRQAYLAWTWCRFPSCAYFMKHHVMGEHWEKMQELCAMPFWSQYAAHAHALFRMGSSRAASRAGLGMESIAP